jgi:hypothetical protein
VSATVSIAARLSAPRPGAYEINVDATRNGGQPVGSGVAYVRAAASEAEYFDPTMHAAPLRRIAEETGGKFYTTRPRRDCRKTCGMPDAA